MAAQRFYLEISDMPSADKLKSFVKSWIPSESLKAKEDGFWEDAIKNVLAKDFQGQKLSSVSLKIDIVNFTKENWHLPFSRFYDALRLSGPDISWSAVIIAVNWKGFYVIDDMSNSRLEILYMEIVNVSRERYYIYIYINPQRFSVEQSNLSVSAIELRAMVFHFVDLSVYMDTTFKSIVSSNTFFPSFCASHLIDIICGICA